MCATLVENKRRQIIYLFYKFASQQLQISKFSFLFRHVKLGLQIADCHVITCKEMGRSSTQSGVPGYSNTERQRNTSDRWENGFMAFSQSKLCSLSASHFPRRKLRITCSSETNNFACKLKTHYLFSFSKLHRAKLNFKHNPKTFCQFCVSRDEEYGNIDSGFPKVLRKPIGFIRSILPGGSWWSLSENREDEVKAAKPMTVLLALHRIWELVSDEKWVIFVAFGSLAISAVSGLEVLSPLYPQCILRVMLKNSSACFTHEVQLLYLGC